MKEHDRRMNEVNEFHQCIEDAKVENKKLATNEIDEFEQYKRKVRHTWTNLF